jgi:uncharacterized protein YaiL (DUF2058 family)
VGEVCGGCSNGATAALAAEQWLLMAWRCSSSSMARWRLLQQRRAAPLASTAAAPTQERKSQQGERERQLGVAAGRRESRCCEEGPRESRGCEETEGEEVGLT